MTTKQVNFQHLNKTQPVPVRDNIIPSTVNSSSISDLQIPGLKRNVAVYVPPVPSNYPDLHSCDECGDKFVVQSSYVMHISRKSVSLRHICLKNKNSFIFYNRCSFLAHLRKHHEAREIDVLLQEVEVSVLPKQIFNRGLKVTTPVRPVVRNPNPYSNQNRNLNPLPPPPPPSSYTIPTINQRKKFVTLQKVNGQILASVPKPSVAPSLLVTTPTQNGDPVISKCIKPTDSATSKASETPSPVIANPSNAFAVNGQAPGLIILNAPNNNIGNLNALTSSGAKILINSLPNHNIMLCETGLVAVPHQAANVLMNPFPNQANYVVDNNAGVPPAPSLLFNNNPVTLVNTTTGATINKDITGNSLSTNSISLSKETSNLTSVTTNLSIFTTAPISTSAPVSTFAPISTIAPISTAAPISTVAPISTPALTPPTVAETIKRPGLVLKNIGSLLEKKSVESSDKACSKKLARITPHSSNKVKRIYKNDGYCYDCSITIAPPMTLASHMVGEDKPNDSSPNYCATCCLILPTPCSLKSHKRLHKQAAPYICPECGLLFTESQLLIKHFSRSCFHLEKCIRYKCFFSNCNVELFTESIFFINHLIDVHSNQVFKCRYCPIACHAQVGLYIHVSQSHADIPNFTTVPAGPYYRCDICPDRLIPSGRLRSHMSDHAKKDTRIYAYLCKTCKFISTSKAQHARHVVICTGRKPKVNVPSSSTLKAPKREIIHLKTSDLLPKKTVTKLDSTNDKDGRKTVIKRCLNCKKDVMINCNEEDIKNLTQFCLQCTSVKSKKPSTGQTEKESQSAVVCVTKPVTTVVKDGKIECHVCKELISITWNDINKHYTDLHPEVNLNELKPIRQIQKTESHRKFKKILPKPASDTSVHAIQEVKPPAAVKSLLKRQSIDVVPIKTENNNDGPSKNKRRRKSPIIKSPRKVDENPFSGGLNVPPKEETNKELEGKKCAKCKYTTESEDEFKAHILGHRDVSTAYQCMECGTCFMVKPSLEKHLLISHSVTDVDAYLKSHECVDKEAVKAVLASSIGGITNSQEDLKENQCRICKEQFENSADLDKHFRVHGLAFVKQQKIGKMMH